MKKLSVAIVLIGLLETPGFTQVQPISTLRPLDDNHTLATDSSGWKIHRVIKEIPVGKSTPSMYLSFGGEIREQFRFYNPVNFGDVDSGISSKDMYLQQRFLLHSDLLVNRHFRFFVQFNSCHVTGKNTLSPQVDRDDLGLMQAFADLNFNAFFPVRLRLGRQEFFFGLERLLGVRDGPTIRQTYDGARLSLKPEGLSGDFFLIRPVSYNMGVFDNSWRRKEYVLGSYWSIHLTNHNQLDVYYFGAGFQNAIYANDTANEKRHSAGLRLSKNAGAFSYDIEFTGQFGNHGRHDIRAWQLSSQFAYRWQNLSWRPRILLREAVFSGDRHQDDGVVNTFRPVSAKPPVHDLVSMGPANIALVSPEAEISLYKGLTFTVRYLWVRRLSANDGLYTSDVRRMTREIDTAAKKQGQSITNGIAAEFAYFANNHLAMLLYGGIFKAGDYIRKTGEGLNVAAFSLRVTYKL